MEGSKTELRISEFGAIYRDFIHIENANDEARLIKAIAKHQMSLEFYTLILYAFNQIPINDISIRHFNVLEKVLNHTDLPKAQLPLLAFKTLQQLYAISARMLQFANKHYFQIVLNHFCEHLRQIDQNNNELRDRVNQFNATVSAQPEKITAELDTLYQDLKALKLREKQIIAQIKTNLEPLLINLQLNLPNQQALAANLCNGFLMYDEELVVGTSGIFLKALEIDNKRAGTASQLFNSAQNCLVPLNIKANMIDKLSEENKTPADAKQLETDKSDTAFSANTLTALGQLFNNFMQYSEDLFKKNTTPADYQKLANCISAANKLCGTIAATPITTIRGHYHIPDEAPMVLTEDDAELFNFAVFINEQATTAANRSTEITEASMTIEEENTDIQLPNTEEQNETDDSVLAEADIIESPRSPRESSTTDSPTATTDAIQTLKKATLQQEQAEQINIDTLGLADMHTFAAQYNATKNNNIPEAIASWLSLNYERLKSTTSTDKEFLLKYTSLSIILINQTDNIQDIELEGPSQFIEILAQAACQFLQLYHQQHINDSDLQDTNIDNISNIYALFIKIASCASANLQQLTATLNGFPISFLQKTADLIRFTLEHGEMPEWHNDIITILMQIIKNHSKTISIMSVVIDNKSVSFPLYTLQTLIKLSKFDSTQNHICSNLLTTCYQQGLFSNDNAFICSALKLIRAELKSAQQPNPKTMEIIIAMLTTIANADFSFTKNTEADPESKALNYQIECMFIMLTNADDKICSSLLDVSASLLNNQHIPHQQAKLTFSSKSSRFTDLFVDFLIQIGSKNTTNVDDVNRAFQLLEQGLQQNKFQDNNETRKIEPRKKTATTDTEKKHRGSTTTDDSDNKSGLSSDSDSQSSKAGTISDSGAPTQRKTKKNRRSTHTKTKKTLKKRSSYELRLVRIAQYAIDSISNPISPQTHQRSSELLKLLLTKIEFIITEPYLQADSNKYSLIQLAVVKNSVDLLNMIDEDLETKARLLTSTSQHLEKFTYNRPHLTNLPPTTLGESLTVKNAPLILVAILQYDHLLSNNFLTSSPTSPAREEQQILDYLIANMDAINPGIIPASGVIDLLYKGKFSYAKQCIQNVIDLLRSSTWNEQKIYFLADTYNTEQHFEKIFQTACNFRAIDLVKLMLQYLHNTKNMRESLTRPRSESDIPTSRPLLSSIKSSTLNLTRLLPRGVVPIPSKNSSSDSEVRTLEHPEMTQLNHHEFCVRIEQSVIDNCAINLLRQGIAVHDDKTNASEGVPADESRDRLPAIRKPHSRSPSPPTTSGISANQQILDVLMAILNYASKSAIQTCFTDVLRKKTQALVTDKKVISLQMLPESVKTIFEQLVDHGIENDLLDSESIDIAFKIACNCYLSTVTGKLVNRASASLVDDMFIQIVRDLKNVHLQEKSALSITLDAKLVANFEAIFMILRANAQTNSLSIAANELYDYYCQCREQWLKEGDQKPPLCFSSSSKASDNEKTQQHGQREQINLTPLALCRLLIRRLFLPDATNRPDKYTVYELCTQALDRQQYDTQSGILTYLVSYLVDCELNSSIFSPEGIESKEAQELLELIDTWGTTRPDSNIKYANGKHIMFIRCLRLQRYDACRKMLPNMEINVLLKIYLTLQTTKQRDITMAVEKTLPNADLAAIESNQGKSPIRFFLEQCYHIIIGKQLQVEDNLTGLMYLAKRSQQKLISRAVNKDGLLYMLKLTAKEHYREVASYIDTTNGDNQNAVMFLYNLVQSTDNPDICRSNRVLLTKACFKCGANVYTTGKMRLYQKILRDFCIEGDLEAVRLVLPKFVKQKVIFTADIFAAIASHKQQETSKQLVDAFLCTDLEGENIMAHSLRCHSDTSDTGTLPTLIWLAQYIASLPIENDQASHAFDTLVYMLNKLYQIALENDALKLQISASINSTDRLGKTLLYYTPQYLHRFPDQILTAIQYQILLGADFATVDNVLITAIATNPNKDIRRQIIDTISKTTIDEKNSLLQLLSCQYNSKDHPLPLEWLAFSISTESEQNAQYILDTLEYILDTLKILAKSDGQLAMKIAKIINTKDFKGNTVIYYIPKYCVKFPNNVRAIIQQLLDLGGDINNLNDVDETPLCMITQHCPVKVIEWATNKIPGINLRPTPKKFGNVGISKFLSAKTVDLDYYIRANANKNDREAIREVINEARLTADSKRNVPVDSIQLPGPGGGSN